MPHPPRSLVALALLALAACAGDMDPAGTDADPLAPELAAAGWAGPTPVFTDPAVEERIETALLELGAELEARIAGIRPAEVALEGVWWTGRVEERTMGGFVYFEDRGDKRLPIQWVHGDPRRGGRTDIGYAVGGAGLAPLDGPGVTAAQVEAAIDRAMETWGSQGCSKGLEINKRTFEEWVAFEADILHGWFDALPPGIIGITFPFIFVDENDDPTDIDGNGAMDYAGAVILYSNAAGLAWGIDELVDVESIALHEAGHGLGQGHFGAAFETIANGKLHFSPRSVMNAGYSGPRQSLTGTDRAGHCGLFGNWSVQ